MITNSDILAIFRTCVPIGKRISVDEIHSIVEDNSELTRQDWAPHPSEVRRHRTYPSWKRKVQAALHDLKVKGRIQHLEETNEYIFRASTFS